MKDLVEIDLLQKAGSLNEEDVYKFKEAYESQKNAMDFIGGDDDVFVSELPGIDTENKITNNTRMNPDYIYMLAMFFFFMQKSLRIPSMSFGAV